MIQHLLNELHQMVLWPGDTVIAWLVTAHPWLALWLGLQADSTGGLVSALISVVFGWGCYMMMGHLTLLGVQLWETRQSRPSHGRLPPRDNGEQ